MLQPNNYVQKLDLIIISFLFIVLNEGGGGDEK